MAISHLAYLRSTCGRCWLASRVLANNISTMSSSSLVRFCIIETHPEEEWMTGIFLRSERLFLRCFACQRQIIGFVPTGTCLEHHLACQWPHRDDHLQQISCTASASTCWHSILVYILFSPLAAYDGTDLPAKLIPCWSSF